MLPDYRHVDHADVYCADARVGILRRDGEGTAFDYDPDYIRTGGRAIAWTLPVSAESVRAAAGAVPAFFAGLLPEGARLQAIVTGMRASADDHLTLLLAVAHDAVGDVSVVPPGEHPGTPEVAVDENDVARLDLAGVFARALAVGSADFDRTSLPGVQDKVSAAMISAPVRTSGGPAILKIDPVDGYPRLSANEHFFLGMAQSCGIPVPEHRLVTDRTGRQGLLVRRFDRFQRPDGTIARLRQEDAGQVLGVYPAAKYRVKTEDVAIGMADAVAGLGGSRPLALRRVLELVAFSYLVGNGDLHAKNISYLVNPDGLAGVAPAYDIVTTQPYLRWRDPMALDLYGRANRLTRTHLMEAAGRLGLPPRVLQASLDRMVDLVPGFADRVAEIGLAEPLGERLAEMIRHRAVELSR